MILPEEIFKRANAELDRVAKELGLSGEVVEDARAELKKQLLADPFLQAVISAPKSEENYGARLQAWRDKIGDSPATVQPLAQGANGRVDELSVEDIKFLAALEIDVLTEAPPDRREWKPRAENFQD
jgi:hypothetical protein